MVSKIDSFGENSFDVLINGGRLDIPQTNAANFRRQSSGLMTNVETKQALENVTSRFVAGKLIVGRFLLKTIV